MIERAAPPPDIAELVEEFSARAANATCSAFPVFPSARAELLFHFGDPFLVANESPVDFRPLPGATLLGPRRRRYWQMAGPRIDWFIVQLTPLGCRRLLDCRFADLWHREAALADFWGGSAMECHERLSAAATMAEKVGIATAALRRLARPSCGAPAMSRLVHLARRGRLRSTVSFADAAGVGHRRLRQLFGDEIGVGPKHFLSLMRFGRQLTAVHPRPWMNALELDPEYADQSHAIREFRRFAGTTPGDYRAAKMSGDDLVFTGAPAFLP